MSDITRIVYGGIKFTAVRIDTSHVTSEEESFVTRSKTSAS